MTKKKKKNNILFAVIIGILLIVAGAVFFEKDSPPENIQQAYEGYKESGEVDWELVYGDDWEGYLQEELEEEGYEVMEILIMDASNSPIVIYFGDADKISNGKTINVQMKSLGNRASQIQKVITNSVLMDEVYGFWVDIHSPTDTCTYVIKWDDWVSCLNDETYTCNPDKFVTEDSLLSCE